MKTPLHRLILAAGLFWGACCGRQTGAQTLPLEIRQPDTTWNFRSQRGVPISSVVGVPPGSDGRMTNRNESGSALLPTTNQFRGFISFGGIPGLVSNEWVAASNSAILKAGSSAFSATVARDMKLPVGLSNSAVAIVFRRAQVGAPYLSRQVSFPFGSIVQAPTTDESGLPLTGAALNTYWLPEPYTTNGHTNAPYYWSPHARKVYAIQAGPVSIRWIKAAYTQTPPADYAVNPGNYYVNGGNYFRLYTVNYVVSGTPVKPPRRMYWTEREFQLMGKPIPVPTARVGAVNIVYNNNFPRTVSRQYSGPGQTSPTDGSTNQTLSELRTLWYDQQQGNIYAYNQEGRVFVELLGDARADGQTREPLGFEIVDVVKQPSPLDVRIELGDRIVPPAPGSLDILSPEPVVQAGGPVFAYTHSVDGKDETILYSTRETSNLNDYLVHWMEIGEVGLKWPALLGRYQLVWPADLARYSHYVRPLGVSESEAKLTAVSLPTANVPVIEFQDPLDRPRAKLTESFQFYTFLDPAYPLHRTLLRFNAGDQVAFERVFSWLDSNLKAGSFPGDSIASELNGWNSTNNTLVISNALAAPRIVSRVVEVGSRIEVPADESSSSDGYLAGHIKVSEGDLYDITAYADPFEKGFEAANQGAIIPVNTLPGRDRLEVWWFRSNNAETSAGFKDVYWPSVIGRYQIRWPVSPREIVLASNDGSGPLTSLEAQGQVYFQNDRALPGYNPNEEHAFLQGGQVWVLRDDLNITSGTNVSSEPYVLLSHVAADLRPAMEVFKVLCEQGADSFNYQVEAGSILQPPMPLPLMEKPLGPKVTGSEPRSLNQETYYRSVASSTAQGLLTTTEPHHFRPWFRELALQSPDLQTVRWIFATNVDYLARTLQGPISNNRGTQPTSATILPNITELALIDEHEDLRLFDGTYCVRTYRITVRTTIRFTLPPTLPVTVGQGLYVIAPPLGLAWFGTTTAAASNVVEVQMVATDTHKTEEDIGSGRSASDIPKLTLSSSEIIAKAARLIPPAPTAAELAHGSLLFVPTGTPVANQYNGWQLRTEPIPSSREESFGAFTLQDRKGGIWVYRGPHGPNDPSYLVMQFYYRTLPGFFFPMLSLAEQPPVGTITPYLRNRQTDGTFVGDPVRGNHDDPLNGDNNALGIYYRPVWPSTTPVLQMAETLTEPKRGLPAIRGQTSLEIVYQQSQVTNLNRVSVRLHDPTREKEFALGPAEGTAVLGSIPDSVKTESSRGLVYFPLLPPHLSQRFFYDPNRGSNGKLVFKGEFVNETVGDDYLHLNVLTPRDATSLSNLCLVSDPARGRWNEAIASLRTEMQTFVESPQQPGTYVPAEGSLVVEPNQLAEVLDDDVAVDSYALTAVGPGQGYVTLIAGNGLAFTPREEPVSVLVLRVSNVLYPGELKVIPPANPLGEQLTLQQVVDLAGEVEDYDFQWKIAAPTDGLPPRVYQTTRRLLLGDGTWQHVPFPLGPQDGISVVQTSGQPRTEPLDAPGAGVVAVSAISYNLATPYHGGFEFQVPSGHRLARGNEVIAFGELTTGQALSFQEIPGIVREDSIPTTLRVDFPSNDFRVLELREAAASEGISQSTLYREFTVASTPYSQLWLSLDLDPFLSARVYFNGEPVIVANSGSQDTPTGTPPAGLDPLPRAYLIDPSILTRGRPDGVQRIAVELFSTALPGTPQRFNLRLEAFEAVDQTSVAGSQWLDLDPAKFPDGVRTVIGEAADVRALSDNYVIMRYRANNTNHAAAATGWSRWTTPQLAEGWIKRVLAGINPFNQRVSDLFNYRVNTDVSLLTAAGRRWEGDVALNLENINNFGLIEIYETVLRRGRLLSIDGGINYGPANDALLLAAGYLSDLYKIVGDEAWADAANPTIGIGTANRTYGDIATALFSFKGQVVSLLEEELALLRGRDDFLQPGVERAPVYNRLVWNYTRGIDAGEVSYAVNYNIQENPDQAPDGTINAEDAARLFPQGHGDAYGHYLIALKGYYSLLLNNDFDWVPRIEAVSVLGQPVSVDYQDERKFAGVAAALGRAGRQIVELTWRSDTVPGHDSGWSHFSPTRSNTQRQVPTTRYWGFDHWASRVGGGNYLHWIVGNSILPAVDPDPTHEGIQKVDRTTVPELRELATMARDLQAAVDNADAGLTPLGLPAGSLALDINPNAVGGEDNGTHFEQIYNRAKSTLNNAVAAFDDAKDVTRLMRSEQDSLTDFQASVARQELAYESALIELYGTPYTDDIGPGGTYKQGYPGPDLIHFAYADMPQLTFPGLLTNTQPQSFRLDIQDFTGEYEGSTKTRFDFVRRAVVNNTNAYRADIDYVDFTLGPSGSFEKPAEWSGRRASPGKLQEAISRIHLSRAAALSTLSAHEGLKRRLDRSIEFFESGNDVYGRIHGWDEEKAITQASLESAIFVAKMAHLATETWGTALEDATRTAIAYLPTLTIAGVAVGTDFAAPARGSLLAALATAKVAKGPINFAREFTTGAFKLATETTMRFRDVREIQPLLRSVERQRAVLELDATLVELQNSLYTINQRLQELDEAVGRYRSLLAQGDRIQAEREVYRQRTAAVIQGYRTRDAAFRFFRNEKLERYKALFDLAARYSYLAANAYDYETGLLDSSAGRNFMARIVSSRALGVVRNGEPQYAGSNTGDPGLSSALAEMKADWDVVKGRLGLNRPDAYGTTVSMRTENFRILSSTNSDPVWVDILQRSRRSNLLQDDDVRRYCLELSRGDGIPVPGIILEFSTRIEDGFNLFGHELAAGDHSFSASAFATRIFAVGVALEGYRGMDQPSANSGNGGISPPDPDGWFTDPLGLSATPYLYLIPVGVDYMRRAPLDGSGQVRSWSVDDVAIPLPFNIGASQLETENSYTSSASLSEPLFAVRKHQAFRPVPSADFFSTSLYGLSGTLQRSQYTNNRLVGRSAWNNRWKLVIPGHALLSDPEQGLERLVKTVRDIKLHFVTYSYSGN